MKSVLPERKTLHPHSIEHRELSPATGQAVRELAYEIAITFDPAPGATAHTLTDPALIERITARAGELPAEARMVMRPPTTATGATVVHGLPLTDDECGPTPPDWRMAARWSGDPDHRSCSFQIDIAMLLLATLAGEPFGWQGQQNGRLVNNIIPAIGHEDEQSGASSSTLLSPHTEDAFHPRRANLLMLACLRNPDRVGTTVSSVRQVELDARQRRILGTPTLPILPDVSYGCGFDRATAPAVPTIWSESDEFETDTTPDDLTLRFDPAYTPLDAADPDFRAAYRHLEEELERVCILAVLEPGELLLVDNDVAVHGRVPFTARYDGTDRWLKRVNIRLPERRRRPTESRENGYGQQIVAPFGAARPETVAAQTQRDGTDDRGSVEHT
ncbi:TauD/TfdA family dioxygenase [Nocardia paucivorans]|uniref:TauD/TfdA family dioxygenase n=1 Tax=Nocardia paucivorans TaxID=114259 RepID=UPI0002EB34FE|nr:TauD/TfdA family dioxygenase [Nocardia paucivorans]